MLKGHEFIHNRQASGKTKKFSENPFSGSRVLGIESLGYVLFQRCVGDLRRREFLTMVLAENKTR